MLLLWAAPAAFAQVSFAAAAELPGSEPAAVAIGDLDRDEIGGVVTANRLADDIGFFLGDGFGGVGLPGAFGVSDAPRAIAIGDFDGDAKPDVAVANQGSADVAVLLGDGTDCFRGPASTTSATARRRSRPATGTTTPTGLGGDLLQGLRRRPVRPGPRGPRAAVPGPAGPRAGGAGGVAGREGRPRGSGRRSDDRLPQHVTHAPAVRPHAAARPLPGPVFATCVRVTLARGTKVFYRGQRRIRSGRCSSACRGRGAPRAGSDTVALTWRQGTRTVTLKQPVRLTRRPASSAARLARPTTSGAVR